MRAAKSSAQATHDLTVGASASAECDSAILGAERHCAGGTAISVCFAEGIGIVVGPGERMFVSGTGIVVGCAELDGAGDSLPDLHPTAANPRSNAAQQHTVTRFIIEAPHTRRLASAIRTSRAQFANVSPAPPLTNRVPALDSQSCRPVSAALPF